MDSVQIIKINKFKILIKDFIQNTNFGMMDNLNNKNLKLLYNYYLGFYDCFIIFAETPLKPEDVNDFIFDKIKQKAVELLS